MSEVLKSLSGDMAAVVKQASASIVRVEARRRAAASGVIYSEDGIIVTANHVVERDDNIRIGLVDGSVVNATVIGRDPSTDIALLRIQAKGLTPARWVETAAVQVGNLVLAVGRPGERAQATLGIVSALDEGWRTSAGGLIDAYLQTDVVMYPGFSGGPLVGADGGFLGINSSALARGVSVTIPPATIVRVANSLTTHGRVRRGYLGVSAQPVRLPEALAKTVGQETGLLIVSVEAGSPAEHAGLTLGDTLISLAGEPVPQMDHLMALLTGDRVGTAVNVKIVRGGAAHEVNVTIGERA
jgi:S1-C subfamily serine protease